MVHPAKEGEGLSPLARGILVFAFLASGSAGLVYEVVWARMLGNVFGNTTFAIGTVLAAFMGGLALGSWLLGRVADRSRHPLQLYAVLELGIAAYGLLFPSFLRIVQVLQKWVFHRLGYGFVGFTALRVFLTLALLLVPTLLLGGTLPVLSRAFVRSARRIGSEVGLLYTVNTVGAVGGAFSAGFLLIPWLGVRGTLWFAAGMSAMAGGIALLVSRWFKPARQRAATVVVPELSAPVRTVLIAALLWGFASFCYEVLWTRVLVFTFSSSTYAFSTMLVTFLVGLALGGGLGAALADRLQRPLVALAAVQTGVGVAALLSLWALGRTGDFYQWAMTHIPLVSWWHWNAVRFTEAFLVMLPPALLIGTAFPVAVKVVASDKETLGTRVGSLYAWNTIGGVGGSLAASFLLLPVLGSQRGLVCASSLNFFAAALVCHPGLRKGIQRAAVVLGAALLAAAGFLAFPQNYLIRVFSFNQKGSDLLFCKEGINGSITVHQYPDHPIVCVNNVLVAGTAFDLRTTQKLQGHIPMLLHPNPRYVMQVGYGTGETSRVVALYGVEHLDGIELVPEIVEASRFFLEINGGIFSRPVFRPIFADGKNYAALTPAKYDVIMNDSVHPAEVSNASLYTLEYFRDCRERLREGGIMSSWLPLFGLDLEDFRCILRTFQEVFPHSTLWIANNYRMRHALLVGWKDGPARIDLSAIEQKLQDEAIKRDLEEIHIFSAVHFVDCLVLDEAGLRDFTRGAPINTDDRPYLDFHVPRVLGPDEIIWARNLEAALRFRRPTWKVVQISGPDSARRREQLRRQALASSVLWRGIVSELRGEVAQARQYYQMAAQMNPEDPDPPFLLLTSRANVAALRRRAELDPKDLSCRLRLGVLYLGDSRLDSARIFFEEALRLSPRSAEALANLGAVFLMAGQPDSALPRLQRALALDPNLALAHYNLGLALVQARRDYRGAARAWKRAIELDPLYQPAHYNLALALLALGMEEQARRELEICVSLSPDDAWSHRMLGMLCARAGYRTQALFHLKEYHRLRPFSQDAREVEKQIRRLEEPEPTGGPG
ncbi:MAG: fused MFS/spermidine synthase [candidate division KSB1 bacterium]|nr:fused MFS/spermidine synthase [candidate division KSB1 bacterium]